LSGEYGQDIIYNIKSRGYVGNAIDTTDTIFGVPGGECRNIYAVVDASEANICDYDTLTIIAWLEAFPGRYDTCVQLVHVVEPLPVPLLNTTFVVVLILVLMSSIAIIIKRRSLVKS